MARELSAWKRSERRKPLVVRGARQVGKTFSIEHLGKTEFAAYVKVDLERNREWHRIFEGNLDPRRIVSELEVVVGERIVPGSTLLFLDEVQACPRALMALRYFHEELPGLHVVAAGSLLEFAMGEVSFPVGRVQFIEMYPMTFQEYLGAMGLEQAAEVVSGEPKPVPEAVHSLLLDQLKSYCFVGGMPEAVQTYATTKSLRATFAVHHELCEAFRQDFAKYTPRCDPLCLDAVFRRVARDVGHQVRYSRLAEDFDPKTARKAFELLQKARVIRSVPCTAPSGLPLGASGSSKRVKALMVDVGLWQSLSGMSVETEHAKDDLLDVYRGAMAEQFVGQEMVVSQGSELYYWSREARGSSAEVDYLAVIDGAVFGVEVKSGPAGKLRSLHLLLETYPTCKGGLVFSTAPYAEMPDRKLTFLPLYFAGSATARGTRPTLCAEDVRGWA